MTAPPISPSASTRTLAPSASAPVADAGSKAVVFAEVLARFKAEHQASEKRDKAAGRLPAAKHEPATTEKQQKEAAAPDANTALWGTAPVATPAADHRAWLLALPRTEQGASVDIATKDGPTTADGGDTQKSAISAMQSAPAGISKQQIAFGATLPKTEVSAQAGKENADASRTLAPMDEKADTGKQSSGSSHSGSHSGSRDSSASDPHAEKASANGTPGTAMAGAAPQGLQTHVAASPSGAVAASASAEHVSNAYTAPAAKPIPLTPVSTAAEVKEPPVSTHAAPTHIDLQSGDVNVRVSQRAGDVQITVRTADNEIAQSLRQHLPDLADKLIQSGVHADLWKPSSAQSSSSDHGGDSSSQEQWQGQQQSGTSEGRQQQQEQQQNRPYRQDMWQRELTAAGSDPQ